MNLQKYIVTDTFSYNTKIFTKGTIFDVQATKFDSQTIAWLKCNGSIEEYKGSNVNETVKEEPVIKEEKIVEEVKSVVKKKRVKKQ